jgi:hypothetical protein
MYKNTGAVSGYGIILIFIKRFLRVAAMIFAIYSYIPPFQP